MSSSSANPAANPARVRCVAMSALGYGAYTSWEFFAREQLALTLQEAHISLWGPIFGVAAITFALIAILSSFGILSSLRKSRSLIIVYVALVCVLALIATGSLSSNVLLAFIALALVGIAIPWFLCGWIECLASLQVRDALLALTIAEGIACGILFLESFVAPPLSFITSAALLLVSVLCLRFYPDTDDGSLPSERTARATGPSWPLVLLACALVAFGFVAIFLRTATARVSAITPRDICLASLGACVLLGIAWAVSNFSRRDFEQPLRACLFAALCVLVVSAIMQIGERLAFLVCIRLGFAYVLLCGLGSHRQTGADAVFCGSALWTCSYAGYSLGGFAGALVPALSSWGEAAFLLAALGVTVLLWVTSFLIAPAAQILLRWTANREKVRSPLTNIPSALDTSAHASSRAFQDAGLSDREREVASLLAEGRDTAYIAKALFISPNTVKMHRRNIYKKLDIHSQQEIIARTHG